MPRLRLTPRRAWWVTMLRTILVVAGLLFAAAGAHAAERGAKVPFTFAGTVPGGILPIAFD